MSNFRKISHEIPDERVFWIGYQEVKLPNDTAETDYMLSGNTKWVSLYSPRAADLDKKVVIAEIGEPKIPDDYDVLQMDDAVYFFDSMPSQDVKHQSWRDIV
jgi:hypothetical protein